MIHRRENAAFIQRLSLLLCGDAPDVNLRHVKTNDDAIADAIMIAHLLHDINLFVAAPAHFEYCAAVAPAELLQKIVICSTRARMAGLFG